MERVTGIGGMFFRAKEPQALAAWYEQHLGIRRLVEPMLLAHLDVSKYRKGEARR